MRIDHNYFNGHSVTSGNESVLLVLTDAFRDAFLAYEGNLFVGCLKDPSNLIDEKEMISVKTGSARVRNNTVLDCDAGFVSLRETNRSIVEGNWLENGSFIKNWLSTTLRRVDGCDGSGRVNKARTWRSR